jgi:hypothetical protein
LEEVGGRKGVEERPCLTNRFKQQPQNIRFDTRVCSIWSASTLLHLLGTPMCVL